MDIVQLDGEFVLLSSIVFSAIRKRVLSPSLDGSYKNLVAFSFLFFFASPSK